MEFKEEIKKLVERIKTQKNSIETEEATKHAFVLPFIQTLGYDIFNPLEVTPEYVADISTKKSEKVDYCIQRDGKPIIIIECKHWKENLDLHNTQLERYFNVTSAKFAVLTNGIQYKFYTDIDETNKMDKKPFLEINLENLKDNDLEQLYAFQKERFDEDKIYSVAGELKYYNEIKNIYQNELQNPSNELVKLFATRVYNGRITERVLENFRRIVKKALNDKINEIINERLIAVMESQNEKDTNNQEDEDDNIVSKDETKGIITTKDEIKGYEIVVDILKEMVDQDRILYKDTKSYFSIFLETNRKPICKIYFNNPKHKYLGIIKPDKSEVKVSIEKPEHIYIYAKDLKQILKKYLDEEK